MVWFHVCYIQGLFHICYMCSSSISYMFRAVDVEVLVVVSLRTATKNSITSVIKNGHIHVHLFQIKLNTHWTFQFVSQNMLETTWYFSEMSLHAWLGCLFETCWVFYLRRWHLNFKLKRVEKSLPSVLPSNPFCFTIFTHVKLSSIRNIWTGWAQMALRFSACRPRPHTLS